MYPTKSDIGIPRRKWLTASGDGLGTYNLIGDYSAAPVDFYYLSTTKFYIKSLLICISDNLQFNQVDYGAIAGGLTNGVGFFYKPFDGVEVRLINTVNIKQNFEWPAISEHVTLTQFAGLPQTLQIDLDLVDEFGLPFNLRSGGKFIVRLNDNLTTLVSHTFGIKGNDLLHV